MIITCPNCNKQFKIDNSLIPEEGRDLQCGSCNHIWFYKIEQDKNEVLKLNETTIRKNNKTKERFESNFIVLVDKEGNRLNLPTHIKNYTKNLKRERGRERTPMRRHRR